MKIVVEQVFVGQQKHQCPLIMQQAQLKRLLARDHKAAFVAFHCMLDRRPFRNRPSG